MFSLHHLVRRSMRLGLVLVAAFAAGCATQPAATAQYPVAAYQAPSEIDRLVAPIALYPDDLIAIILPASTRPIEIAQAARFLQARAAEPALQPDPYWDDSIIALLNYPTVVQMLADDLDWTAALGDAVMDRQDAVMDAVQRFRHEVYAAGNLRSDQHQIVYLNNGVIEIRSADPEVIYVPSYDPARVVVYRSAPAYSWSTIGYPVYYYPYPSYHRFYDSGPFWSLSTFFGISWGERRYHSYRHDNHRHPYYDRRYEHDWRRDYGWRDGRDGWDGRDDRDGRDWRNRDGRDSYATPRPPQREDRTAYPQRRYDPIPTLRPRTDQGRPDDDDRDRTREWTQRDWSNRGSNAPGVQRQESPGERGAQDARDPQREWDGQRDRDLQHRDPRPEQQSRPYVQPARPYGESRGGGNWLDRRAPGDSGVQQERRDARVGGAAPRQVQPQVQPRQWQREGRAAGAPVSSRRQAGRTDMQDDAQAAQQTQSQDDSGERSARTPRGAVMAAPPPEVQAPR